MQLAADAPEELRAFVDAVVDLHGAQLRLERSGGGFSNWSLVFPGLILRLRQEYRNWLLTLETPETSPFSIAYWRQAFEGSDGLPGPSDLEDDLSFLEGHLSDLLVNASTLEPALSSLEKKYRAKMRARYS